MNILTRARQAALSLWVELRPVVIWVGIPAAVASATSWIFGGWLAPIIIYLLTTALIVVVRLWVMREVFMMHLRFIETEIWGKTLDRKNWGGKAPLAAGLLKEKPFAWKHKEAEKNGPAQL